VTTAVEVLIAETCVNCGVFFGMGDGFREQCLTDGRSFYCPNGHRQHYTESTQTKLRKAREEAEAERRRRRATQDLLAHEERRSAAARGQVTKIKKRVAAGVCPCCNRTFQDLAKHMSGQHPDYVKAV
jgi:hypothetical protein